MSNPEQESLLFKDFLKENALDSIVHKSSDTLDLKPLYLGSQEYQKLMDKLKKKKSSGIHGNG